MKVKKSGYVLLLTLMLLSISILVITRLVTPVMARYQQSNLFIRQEKARQLALSGIQIIISYLNEPLLEVQKKKSMPQSIKQPTPAAKESADQDPKKMVWTYIFEILNRWHTITLSDSAENIQGTIDVYVSNEAGKININSLYDFEKKQWFKQGSFDATKVIQVMSDRLKDKIEGINLSDILDTFFKKRGKPLDDVTELIALKEFQAFGSQLFVEKITKPDTQLLFLTDLFTISTKTPMIQPLQLSASLHSLLGLSPLIKKDDEKEVSELVSQIKQNINWQLEWNKILQPRVGKNYNDIPSEIRFLLASEFEANCFSVVSYGNLDAVTQKLYALIEKNTVAEQELFMIKKIYWL